ncbi:MAG: 16S rRNA (guanine(966)-N(2))-methyltransferase RsmD [Acidimicrobiales bacterium]
MRVVAGTVGGRHLSVPPGVATRPTSELVRGAIFNSLTARGVVQKAVVADLFAGSGALGIEALSRGASRAVFVESDRVAARVIAENLATLGLADVATVRVADAVGWAEAQGTAPFDLVLADPPYGFDAWDRLLRAVVTFPVDVLVAESDRPVEAEGWDVLSVKRHGGTVVSQLSPQGAS